MTDKHKHDQHHHQHAPIRFETVWFDSWKKTKTEQDTDAQRISFRLQIFLFVNKLSACMHSEKWMAAGEAEMEKSEKKKWQMQKNMRMQSFEVSQWTERRNDKQWQTR